MKPIVPEPELSRPLRVDRVPVGGIEERIVASAEEREALKKRFGLLELSQFEAFLTVEREQGSMFAVTGKVTAKAVQQCVVTLDPVEEKIEETIDVLFAPPHLIKEDQEVGPSDLAEADPPEPIIGGIIDLGELAAQHMAMALNPYPRKAGASLGVLEVKPADAPSKNPTHKPFAVLAKLVGKDGE